MRCEEISSRALRTHSGMRTGTVESPNGIARKTPASAPARRSETASGAQEEVQQCVIELVRVLKKCKMAGTGKNQFARAGNQPGHAVGIFALDDFVAIAIRDPRGDGDAAQLRVGKIRF